MSGDVGKCANNEIDFLKINISEQAIDQTNPTNDPDFHRLMGKVTKLKTIVFHVSEHQSRHSTFCFHSRKSDGRHRNRNCGT